MVLQLPVEDNLSDQWFRYDKFYTCNKILELIHNAPKQDVEAIFKHIDVIKNYAEKRMLLNK